MGTYFRQSNQQLNRVIHSRFPWFPSKRNRGEGVGDVQNTLNRLVHCENLLMHAAQSHAGPSWSSAMRVIRTACSDCCARPVRGLSEGFQRWAVFVSNAAPPGVSRGDRGVFRIGALNRQTAKSWGIKTKTGEQIGEQIAFVISKSEAGHGFQGFVQ
jgi:hypothetical protein